MKPNSKILIIAGSDSSGGAGIQADIKTVTSLGSYAMTAVTAVTVQNTLGVKSVFSIPPNEIKNQIIYSSTDIRPDAIKIGMLHSSEIVNIVIEALKKIKVKKLVLDPVMVAKGGTKLINQAAVQTLKNKLIKNTYLITPNIPEANILTNIKIQSTDDMIYAGNILRKLTDSDGYDAEATVSPRGDKIVFTSIRSGDLELYTCDLNGDNVKQITNQLGYDGGAFFSHDGNKLVFRSSRPKTESEVKEYKYLLSKGLVQPTKMEIYTCNIDGSDLKQVTDLGKANWSPFFHPSDEKIIFCSNHNSQRGFPFNLFMIDIDGNNLKQITYDDTFDSFPVFSNDGKKIVFSSNRNNGGTRSTNVFIADWVE